MVLALGGIVLGATPSRAAVLDVSWTAPTETADGNPLADLASYRLYYGPSPSCPSQNFIQIASPTPSPEPNQVVRFRITGLSSGTLYYVSVTALNMGGVESACSIGASAVAQLDFSVSPTSSVYFGSVNVGSFADKIFTVQNTRGGTISGSASASPPFSVVAGSPFTLVGDGASQAVKVRFAPTTSIATVSTNIGFTTDGDTISRLATGAAAVSEPTINIVLPTSDSTYRTDSPVISLGGTASDAVGVRGVMWINDRGAIGTAVGTTSWSAGGIGLHPGTNVLTVAVENFAGYIATATLTVTLSVVSAFTGDSEITAGAPVKAIHFAELRDAINTIRVACGLPLFRWTDATIVPGATIKAIHLAELRIALNDAYVSTGRTPPTYTDPTVAAGVIVKGIHLNELRSGILALQ